MNDLRDTAIQAEALRRLYEMQRSACDRRSQRAAGPDEAWQRLREQEARDDERRRRHGEMVRARRKAVSFERGTDGAWALPCPDNASAQT